MSVDSRAPGPAAVPGMAPRGGGGLADRLQELLEQAVEDQLAERRLIAEALGELGGRVEATSAAARDANAELNAAVSKNLVAHSATLGSMVDAVRALPPALQRLQTDLARLCEQLDRVVVPNLEQIAAALAPGLAQQLSASLLPAVTDALRRELAPLLDAGGLPRVELDGRRVREPAPGGTDDAEAAYEGIPDPGDAAPGGGSVSGESAAVRPGPWQSGREELPAQGRRWWQPAR